MFIPGKNKKSEKKVKPSKPKKKETKDSIIQSLFAMARKFKLPARKKKEGESSETLKEDQTGAPKKELQMPVTGGNATDRMAQSLISIGKKIKDRIESNPKFKKLLEKIKNHPRVIWAVDKFQNLDWSERVIVLIGVAGLLLFIFGPYSLLYRKTHLISYEAHKRGEALVHLLAAGNQAAFAANESVLYSVDAVSRERGVNDAVVTDLEGIILSPLERFGKTLDKVKNGVSTKGLTTDQKGLDFEFFYPIFKWVEKDHVFVKY